MSGQVWRCQCPRQCDDDESCWSDVTQEDFLCDWCRVNCSLVAAVSGVAGNPEEAGEK